jgi:hypothetical protein
MKQGFDKTLVILIGNARGGEETWNTMYKNLLEPYNADLALCFGEVKERTSSLYQRAKYIWEIPEYQNWREFYDFNFNSKWDLFFIQQKYVDETLKGGIDDFKGSGAIIFAFRHYLLKNKIEFINQYDRIILTRSDFYYIDKHPILPLGKLYSVEGEEYGGISDRHFIFDSDMSNNVLGILDFLCSESSLETLNKFEENSLNPEKALLIFFKHNEIFQKLEFHKRVQFTVAIEGDLTRWKNSSHFIPGFKNIKYKYVSEYEVALNNSIKKYGIFTKAGYLFFIHWFHKIFLRKASYVFLILTILDTLKKYFPTIYNSIFYIKNNILKKRKSFLKH